MTSTTAWSERCTDERCTGGRPDHFPFGFFFQ
jgi:hypothetical protein